MPFPRSCVILSKPLCVPAWAALVEPPLPVTLRLRVLDSPDECPERRRATCRRPFASEPWHPPRFLQTSDAKRLGADTFV
jgi:hypothetical protein